jgi:hypothetical protein
MHELAWEEYREWSRSPAVPDKRAAQKKTEPPPRVKPVDPEKRMKRLEKEIQPLEERLKELVRLLAEPDTYADAELAKRYSDEYEESNTRLQALYAEWEEVAEQIAA